MVQHHKYSISEVESLLPFERDIYVEMLMGHLKQLEEEQRQRNGI
jgi:hypothetical protein